MWLLAFPYCVDNWQIFKSYFKEFTFNIDKAGQPLKIPTIEMISATTFGVGNMSTPSMNLKMSLKIPTKRTF
ncbi:MAG: hypothetical protein U5L45_22380 [Saprospiraceae bacterium]|nr:hypothetical protein [Saprospiraceae bacterium]